MEWSAVMMWCVVCGMGSGVLCVSSVTHTSDRSLGSPWWGNGCARSGARDLLSEYSCPCPTQHGPSHPTTHGTSIQPSCVQPGWPSPSVVHSFTVAVCTNRHSSEVQP